MATITSLAFNINSNWDGAGVREARNDLLALQADMRRVSGAALHITVDVDTAQAKAELEEFTNQHEDMSVHVNLDTAQARADMERLKLAAGDIGIDFNINETSYAETEARIDFLTRDRTVNIDIDRQRVGATLDEISDKFENMGHRANLAGEQVQHVSRMMMLLRVAVYAALGAGPALVTAFGAALMTLPGIITVALGAAFLSRIQEVKDAFSDLTTTVMEVGTRAAEPMKAPLIEAMQEIRQWVLDNEELFREMYAGAADLIKPMTSALTGFMDNLLPGVNAAIQRSVPFFEELGEGARNLGQSWGNMFSIMSTQAQEFGRTFNLILTYLGRWMEMFGAAATSMAASANIAMSDTFQSFEGFLSGALDGLKGFVDEVAKTKGGLDFFRALGDVIREVLPALGQFYAVLSSALSPALKEIAKPLGELIAAFVTSLVPVINVMAPILLDLAKGFVLIMDAIKPMMPVLGPLAVALWAVNAAANANPYVLLAVAVVGLVAYLVQLEQKTHAFSEAWSAVWARVGEPLTAFWNSAKEIFGKISDSLGPQFTQIWTNIKDAVSDAWTSIKPALDELGRAFGPLWEAAKPVLAAIGGALLLVGDISIHVIQGLIKPAFDGLIEFIRNIIQLLSGFVTFITGVFNTLKGTIEIFFNFFKAIFGLIKGIFTGDFSTFKDALNGLKNGFSDFFHGVGQALSGVARIIDAIWDAIYNTFKTAIGAVIGFVSGFVKGIIHFFTDLWDKLVGHSIVPDMINAIVDWFLSLPRRIFQFVADFVTGIVNFFLDLASKVLTAMQNLWSNLMSALSGFVQGFRNAWDTFWNGVRDFAVGLWNWVKDRWNDFTAGVRAIYDAWAGALKAVWEGFWNGIRDFAVGLWNWVKDRWQDFVNGVRAIYDAWSTALKQVWETFWTGIRDFVKGVWDWIKTKWDEFTTGIRTTLEGFRDRIVEIWTNFWNGIKQKAMDIWDEIKREFNNFKDGVVGTIEGLVQKVDEVWQRITGIFRTPVETVKGIWNGVADAFGLPKFAIGGEVAAPVSRATGGPVNGFGTSTSDSIPAYLSNGEHVWTAQEVDAAGGHDKVYQMRQEVKNGRRQNVGIGNVMQDNKFASGGEVRPPSLDPTIAMAREKGDGRAYVYGGSGPDGFDCSGYMSAIFNSLTGRPLWGRSFSTESDFPSLGFAQGLGAGFSVGIMRGGGGPNSHMAGTLDGVNVESGGGHNSTRYGGPAAGADHSQFPIKYFLPIMNGAFVSGGGGGMGGPSPEQIRMHDEAVAKIRAEMDATNATSASKKFGAAKAERVPLAVFDSQGAKNQYGVFAPAGDVHAAGFQKDGEGAIAKLDAALSSLHGSIGGVVPEGERRRIIEEALRVTNTPPPSTLDAWLAGMNTLITRESGWNPNARNNTDSNAAAGNASVGLAQVIPTTFEANKAPGYNNIYGEVDNVAAAINYIKRRYGTIENVQQANANMPPQGYLGGTQNAAAGWNLVGENGPEMVRFRGGETVKSFNDIVSELKSAADSEGRQLQTKLSADLKTFSDKMIAASKDHNTDLRATLSTELQALVAKMSEDAKLTGQRLSVSIEDALTRLASMAGINITLPPATGDPVKDADSVMKQLMPQLEMALRQGVGTK